MRFAPAVALVLASAALAAFNRATHALPALPPVWALFSFAVSAFREPLR